MVCCSGYVVLLPHAHLESPCHWVRHAMIAMFETGVRTAMSWVVAATPRVARSNVKWKIRGSNEEEMACNMSVRMSSVECLCFSRNKRRSLLLMPRLGTQITASTIQQVPTLMRPTSQCPSPSKHTSHLPMCKTRLLTTTRRTKLDRGVLVTAPTVARSTWRSSACQFVKDRCPHNMVRSGACSWLFFADW